MKSRINIDLGSFISSRQCDASCASIKHSVQGRSTFADTICGVIRNSVNICRLRVSPETVEADRLCLVCMTEQKWIRPLHHGF